MCVCWSLFIDIVTVLKLCAFRKKLLRTLSSGANSNITKTRKVNTKMLFFAQISHRITSHIGNITCTHNNKANINHAQRVTTASTATIAIQHSSNFSFTSRSCACIHAHRSSRAVGAPPLIMHQLPISMAGASSLVVVIAVLAMHE